MGDVDLDRLASAYRFRPASVASVDRAAAAGLRLPTGARILDVGAGPGNHSVVWADQGRRPVVLDPSPAMVAISAERRLDVVAGYSQAMPFRRRTFALVWFHLSIHYGDWKRALNEALRVVDHCGRVEIWTLGEDHHRQSILARWFPSIATIDTRRFPDPLEVEAYLAQRTRSVEVTHPHENIVRPVGAWLEAVEAGFVSTLHMLSSEERSVGNEAVQRAHPDPSEEISYELHFTRIAATRTESDEAGVGRGI